MIGRTRGKKKVMTKIKSKGLVLGHSRGLVLGSVLAPKIDMIWETELEGASVRGLLSIRCCFDAFLHWKSAAEKVLG